MSGSKAPTLRQLDKFAKAARTPFGYLFLPQPPREQLPIPHFRTLTDEPVSPSADLLETVHIMQRRQNWMREHLIEQALEPLPFVRSAKVGEERKLIAREMRRTLGLEGGWAAKQPTWTGALRNLQNRIEDAGVIVVVNGVVGNNTHRKLDPTEFRGFVLVDEYTPLLFVNGADGKAAQMFTLAHELAHVWFGSSAAFDLRDLQPANNDTERACNRVAAEFLVPEDELRSFWSSRKEKPDFQEIARHFKVSELVAARRALDSGFITRDEFVQFYNDYQEREKHKPSKEGGDFYKNQNLRVGRRFAEAIFQAVREGRLLYHEAYHLTGLHGRAFEKYTSCLEFGRAA
ncbi:MAG TPA: ImmA/IrrE family metallo-endopeptidase [Armatimonadota bacterium]|nr:ImmA/IrrE family metallo-endopeptidase [Armatimonadota bacterium]